MSTKTLSIPYKEDTPEKLAYAQGKPVKNFFFASDHKKIVDILKALWSLVVVDPTRFDESRKIDLGTISEPFIDVINSAEPRVFEEPCFVIFTADGVENVYAFVGPSDTYGIEDRQVAEDQFVLLQTSEDTTTVVTPYKVYTALLTQSSGDPTEIVLENTIGDIVWSRDSAGIYNAVLLNAFTENKTALFLSSSNISFASAIIRNSQSLVTVYTGSDGVLNSTTIEIRVYN